MHDYIQTEAHLLFRGSMTLKPSSLGVLGKICLTKWEEDFILHLNLLIVLHVTEDALLQC